MMITINGSRLPPTLLHLAKGLRCGKLIVAWDMYDGNPWELNWILWNVVSDTIVHEALHQYGWGHHQWWGYWVIDLFRAAYMVMYPVASDMGQFRRRP